MGNDKNIQLDWFADSTTLAQENLDTLTLGEDTSNVISSMDKLRNFFTTPQGDSTRVNEEGGGTTSADEGGDYSDIIPALVVPGTQLAQKALSKVPWGMPKGWKGYTRFGGRYGMATKLAFNTNTLIGNYIDEWNKNNPDYQVKGGVELGARALGSAAVYSATSKLAFDLMNNVKTGMVSEVMDKLASKSLLTEFPKLGEPLKKGVVKGGKEATEQAMKTIVTNSKQKVADEMKKVMGEKAAKKWDDVAMKLLNPNRAQKVGGWLAKNGGGWLAKKMAVSSMLFALPEWLSTAAGAVGILWTAYDIINLMDTLPNKHELQKLIFEDPPAPTKKTPEDNLIDQFTASDSMFTDPTPQINRPQQ